MRTTPRRAVANHAATAMPTSASNARSSTPMLWRSPHTIATTTAAAATNAPTAARRRATGTVSASVTTVDHLLCRHFRLFRLVLLDLQAPLDRGEEHPQDRAQHHQVDQDLPRDQQARHVAPRCDVAEPDR